MLSDHRISIRRTFIVLLCSAFFLLLPSPPGLLAAEEIYNARLIRQYVDEDKVNLLENIRQKFSRPSEKLVTEALLCEDGPKAQSMYRKQLSDYPDPELDRISTSRIAAYNLALNSTAPLPKLSQQGAAGSSGSAGTKGNAGSSGNKGPEGNSGTQGSFQLQERANMKSGVYTLQFGSFGSLQNAETLARKVSYYSGAEIIHQNGIYRVRLKKAWQTREDAADAARQLPFDAIVVQSKE
ncbi:MAG: SPOR domain-containing protein [Chlorobiaceae bacterium]|nr:SPOR domain-containing protein [Chlorobiaceae bacterium]